MLKRSFSMSAIARSGQLVRTPIQVFLYFSFLNISFIFQVHGVEGKYAAALYSAAHKQKKLEQVEKDLLSIRDVYESNAKFRVRLLSSFSFF